MMNYCKIERENTTRVAYCTKRHEMAKNILSQPCEFDPFSRKKAVEQPSSTHIKYVTYLGCAFEVDVSSDIGWKMMNRCSSCDAILSAAVEFNIEEL